MDKLFNKIIFGIKFFLLLVCFALSLYVLLLMQSNYDKSYWDVLSGFGPYFLVLIIFALSFSFKKGYNNIYYNLTCIFVFAFIFLVLLRTFFDYNMVYRLRYLANFYYFESQFGIIKLLLYLLFIVNLLLILQEKKNKIKEIHS